MLISQSLLIFSESYLGNISERIIYSLVGQVDRTRKVWGFTRIVVTMKIIKGEKEDRDLAEAMTWPRISQQL